MTDTSARFALPLLQPGQAQKEIFHNEALTLLDIALHGVAESIGDNDPPAAPGPGACWIVGPAPTGAWAGRADHIAGWTAGGWRFVAPVPGMALWLRASGVQARFDGSAWSVGIVPAHAVHVSGQQVVGARQPAIAEPAGGAVVDEQARTAVASILAALRAHGLITA